MSKLQNVRGTKDLFGDEIKIFNNIIQTSKKISQNYGFCELQTPIFELSEVFERNLGDDSDIISKEVYKFLDRSERSLTLRPEFTASVIRSFLSNGQLNQNLPKKFFSYGPIFRYDRPQKGRQRQFNQINFEIIGIQNLNADVEAILLANQILNDLGLKNKSILQINSLGCVNTKAKYETALKEYFTKYKNDLSDDSKRRLEENPLRILDSKDKKDNEIALNAPDISDFYSNEAKENFAQILRKLKDFNISFEVNKRLVRGLDYYTSTVFEFVADDRLGAQNTILAGGRYDNLIAKMGGQDTPAIGFAAGIERLMLLADFKEGDNRPVLIIYVSETEFDYAFNLANKLRQNGIYCEIIYDANNMKKQWKKSDQLNARKAIIIGEEEVKNAVLKVKDLDKGEEKEVKESEILGYLKC